MASIAQTSSYFTVCSSPDPTLEEGRGFGELGQNAWACAKEFPRAKEVTALAQSLTNQIQAMLNC